MVPTVDRDGVELEEGFQITASSLLESIIKVDKQVQRVVMGFLQHAAKFQLDERIEIFILPNVLKTQSWLLIWRPIL